MEISHREALLMNNALSSMLKKSHEAEAYLTAKLVLAQEEIAELKKEVEMNGESKTTIQADAD